MATMAAVHKRAAGDNCHSVLACREPQPDHHAWAEWQLCPIRAGSQWNNRNSASSITA